MMLFAVILCFTSRQALALKCEDSGTGSQDFSVTLPDMSVPFDMPPGTTIWSSATNSIKVKCYKDSSNVGAENVYMYINPKQTIFKNGLIFGLHINGKDYQLKSGTGGSGIYKVNTGVTLPKCKGHNDCDNTVKMFDMTYYLYAKKDTSTPSSGIYEGEDSLRYFQLDGSKGLNRDGNFSFNANGFKRIRFLSCGATASFSPGVVDLGKIAKSNLVVGQRADGVSRAFNLKIEKNCADDFGVNVYYDSPETVSDNGSALELPNGLNLKLKKSSGDYVTFRNIEENFIIRGVGKTSRTEMYSTELYWRKSDPTLGKFSTSATVTLYYN